MRDIHERINAAIERVSSGHALWRVPVDLDTDVDIVLSDADAEIKRLDAEVERLRARLAAARAAFRREEFDNTDTAVWHVDFEALDAALEVEP